MLKPIPNSPRLLSGSFPDQPALTAFSRVSIDMPGPLSLMVMREAWLSVVGRATAMSGWSTAWPLRAACRKPSMELSMSSARQRPLVEVDLAQHLQNSWIGGQV